MRIAMVRVTVILAAFTCLLPATTPAGASTLGSEPFGIAKFTMQTTHTREVPDGTGRDFVTEPYTFTQAGSHPDGLTTTIELAGEKLTTFEGNKIEVPARDAKDLVVTLPPGLLGDPMAVPSCSLTKLLAKFAQTPVCPASTQVGFARLRWFDGEKEEIAPIVNVTPEAGQSAEFALEANPDFLETAHLVRYVNPVTKKSEYGFTVISNDIPTLPELVEVQQTFWGMPADPSHDALRGLFCLKVSASGAMCDSSKGQRGDGGESAGIEPVPFLDMPTDCAAGPERAVARGDSWEQPGRIGTNQTYEGFAEKTVEQPLPTVVGGLSQGFTGCDLLSFQPGVEALAETLLADEPTGLGVNVTVPQPEEPGVLATPHLRNAVVTLPLGMSVSPGVVDGIEACNESGPEGINFTGAESERPGPNGELQLAPGHCPNASAVGTAEAITPLLREPVRGHVFLARPLCGNAALGQAPCTEQDALDGNIYQLYLELGGEGPLGNTGIEIKVRGKTEADPATGQLTSVFEDNPQTPFSELKIHLNGGPRAPIDNPAVCGPAITTADFTPWSAPGITPEGLSVPGLGDATPSSRPFDVEGCANPAPFVPGFVAGTVTPNAGQFSAFTLNIARHDREQFVKGVQIHTPPGLTGILANVPLCGEADANAGTCPGGSKIGTTRVASGAGSHPFEIEGDIYLTGPYRGAPFGLSIVTKAVAGPFNLGLVVVRARIQVDPTDSSLTVTTDETGPYALPQIIFGIPLRLQRITVNIDRPDFMINPTSCKAQQITASISGSGQAVAHLPSPFAVGGCKSLAFTPRFAVSTTGRTSRQAGASLDARLSYPKGALRNDANIASVKVSLPKQLPSYLPTLQKACLAATFNANPAGCPSGSIVGIARATTPLLPVGLSGPVYFVSHGGEEFPSLIIVLQGYGVRVDLIGSTFINKAGITSSTFKTIPDVPVDTFELYLPQGKNHALAANMNLCTAATGSTRIVKRRVARNVHGRRVHVTVTKRIKSPGLVMPSEFIAQNGAVFKQNTKIAVGGCKAKAKTARRARTAGKRKGKSGR